VTRTPNADRARQVLRQATMESHQRVDDLFSHFSLEKRSSYAAFLKAHARALAPLEEIARPDAPRLPMLAQDLAALGEALPTPLAISMLMPPSDAFRWGARYTLEGSRLGGAVLVRRVGPGLPNAYLSATHDKGGWADFQRTLDVAAAGGDGQWIDEAIRGAQAAFDLFATAAGDEVTIVHG